MSRINAEKEEEMKTMTKVDSTREQARKAFEQAVANTWKAFKNRLGEE